MYKPANAKLASPSLAPDKWTSIAGGIVPNSSECVVATTFSSHIKYNWLSQVPILFSKSLHKICLVSNKIHFYLSNWWWGLFYREIFAETHQTLNSAIHCLQTDNPSNSKQFLQKIHMSFNQNSQNPHFF